MASCEERMKRIWIAIAVLLLSVAASFAGAPRAEAICLADPGTGNPCGRCPDLKIIKVYCLQ